jgi:DNA polymerase-3 subunit delta
MHEQGQMSQESGITLLYGNDEYAMARRAAELSRIFKDDQQAEMNTTRLQARSMTDDELHNALNALPFLADKRLVLLENPSDRYAEAESRKKFLGLLSGIPESTRLVMWEQVEVKSWGSAASHEKAEGKHWLVRWIREQGMGLERFALPEAKTMSGWIGEYAKSQGGEFAAAAASRLAELVGNDTRQAAQEITKLLTYVNWSRAVTAKDVETLSPLTAEPDVFAMVDALASGDTGKAQGLLHRLLEAQDAFSTWGMIVRQFRLLLLAREVLDAGGGEAQAMKALEAQAFVARKALGQARGFTMARLERIYHRLLEIDEAAKTGRVPLDLSMDMLVVELGDI